MSNKRYDMSLNGLPDHEHIIFKLICSVSERTKNRTKTYAINTDGNIVSDICINDIKNKTAADEAVASPINVWISDKQENSEHSISRPLIASRVLNTLDQLLDDESNISSSNTEKNSIESTNPARDSGADLIDFNITEEEASELAIVHDDLLENPSNQEVFTPAENQAMSNNVELTLIRNHPSNTQSNIAGQTALPQVLVVDDSPSVRKQLEIELQFFDVNIDFAESAESAFSLLNSNKYDIALLDVVLPDKDGFQICKHIKSENKSTIAIMLTGKATQADKIKGSLAGCNAYLVKPVGRQTFQNTVKNYIPLKPADTAIEA